jgi:hypothetical protein
MDPDLDRIPTPLRIIPDKAIYLINPGENFSDKPYFMKISFDGNIQFNKNLFEIMDIADTAVFAVEDIFVYQNEKTCILFGNSYDSKTNLFYDHEVAFFDSKGTLLKRIVLPKLADLIFWHILEDGRFWAYSKGTKSWILFSTEGEPLHTIKATIMGTLLSDESLLCMGNDGGMILCNTIKKITPIKQVGKSILSGSFVRGGGDFTGIMSSEWDPNIEGIIKKNVTLQIVYYKPSKQNIYVFPQFDLEPVVVIQNDVTVEWYDISSLTFDNSGNFYSVARSGGKKPSLTIYKMEIDEEIVKKLTQDK